MKQITRCNEILMNTEIDRLKQDFVTIGQAIGCEPEFGQRHVWASTGWGISGLVLLLLGIFPHILHAPWGTIAFLVPYLASSYFMIRQSSPASAKDLNSLPLNGIFTAILLGVLFWLRKMAFPIPYGFAMGILCLIAGV